MRRLSLVFAVMLAIVATGCSRKISAVPTDEKLLTLEDVNSLDDAHLAKLAATSLPFINGKIDSDLLTALSAVKIRFVLNRGLSTAEVDRLAQVFVAQSLRLRQANTRGLPPWVSDMYYDLEGDLVNPAEHPGYTKTVGWGTGKYKGKSIYWIGTSDAVGLLEIRLSVRVNEAVADNINGMKQDELDLSKLSGVWSHNDSEGQSSKTTRILMANADMSPQVAWTDEFCEPVDRTSCDTAGAFEKYMLPYANEAMPELGLKTSWYFVN